MLPHPLRGSCVAFLGSLVIVMLGSPTALAQTGSTLSCSDSDTVVLSTDDLGHRLERSLGPAVDTTYLISVNRRSWTWRDPAAGVGAALRGTAPASWDACAAAWASFRRATVVLENAQGLVHVHASLEPLLETLRRHRSVPRENPEREHR